MNILKEIVNKKKEELHLKKEKSPLDTLKRDLERCSIPKRGFREALLKLKDRMAVIAELKKKSPSKGVLRESFDPKEIAGTFEKNGASALSILTDEPYFGGRLDFVPMVREKTSLPILRKDFIIDVYQLYESALYGADAVLLIAEILTPSELTKLAAVSRGLELDCLIETHSEHDIEKVVSIKPDPGKTLLGINNRNLETFEVDLETTFRLMKRIPKNYPVVSESGIRTSEDLSALKKAGVSAVLVGESLMTDPDPGIALKRLCGSHDKG